MAPMDWHEKDDEDLNIEDVEAMMASGTPVEIRGPDHRQILDADGSYCATCLQDWPCVGTSKAELEACALSDEALKIAES